MKKCLIFLLIFSAQCRQRMSETKDDVSNYVPGLPSDLQLPKSPFVPPSVMISGTGDGNSGGGWLCRDKNGKEFIQVIDHHEALHSYAEKVSIPLSPTPGFETPAQGIAFALVQRLPEFDTYRKALYKRYIASFLKEADISKEFKPGRVHDEERLIEKPEGCDPTPIQLVYQHTPRSQDPDQDLPTKMSDDKRYLIFEQHWNMLEDAQKAVLILHEVIYREARYYGQKVSIGVREFVGKILANAIVKQGASNPRRSYGLYLSGDALKLPDYFPINENLAYRLSTMTFHQSNPNVLKEASVVAMTHPSMLDQNLIPDPRIDWDPTLVLNDLPFKGVQTSVPPDTVLVFDEQSRLSAIFDNGSELKRRKQPDDYYANFVYPIIQWTKQQRMNLLEPFECYDAFKPREFFRGVRFDHDRQKIRTLYVLSSKFECSRHQETVQDSPEIPGVYQFDFDYDKNIVKRREPQ